MTTNIIDISATATLLNLPATKVVSYYQLLKKSLEKDRPAIIKSFKQRDWQALRDRMHRMEGGFAYCKAPHLEKLCTQFHQLIKHNPLNPSTLKPELDTLLSAIDQTLAAIKTLPKK